MKWVRAPSVPLSENSATHWLLKPHRKIRVHFVNTIKRKEAILSFFLALKKGTAPKNCPITKEKR